MDNLLDFNVNSDSVALKTIDTVYKFPTISIPAGTYSDNRQWTSVITIPSGQYYILNTINISGTSSTPVGVIPISGDASLGAAIRRDTETSLVLYAEFGVTGGGSAYLEAQTINADFILLPPPI